MTRQATSSKIKPEGIPRLEIAKTSFRWRAAGFFNSLPNSITSEASLEMFKSRAKVWIKENVSFNP